MLICKLYQMYSGTYYKDILILSYVLNNRTTLEASVLFSVRFQMIEECSYFSTYSGFSCLVVVIILLIPNLKSLRFYLLMPVVCSQ